MNATDFTSEPIGYAVRLRAREAERVIANTRYSMLLELTNIFRVKLDEMTSDEQVMDHMAFYRPDIHDMLRELARGLDIPLPPALRTTEHESETP